MGWLKNRILATPDDLLGLLGQAWVIIWCNGNLQKAMGSCVAPISPPAGAYCSLKTVFRAYLRRVWQAIFSGNSDLVSFKQAMTGPRRGYWLQHISCCILPSPKHPQSHLSRGVAARLPKLPTMPS